MKERWTVNKLGLVNFWYYDEEEFDLIDGKLLLRGSNGSGKSVTMQSFIPLLLDGNKRPERLDPFGTNARRIENYLLVNPEETERTAYLYMEFKKKNEEVYLTIGMGLKAVKGRKVDSWYFLINDGRRVKKDLNLYRDKGYEKTPLTKKECENLVGNGGFFTDSQGKYKEKVNEYLFGYSDIESYEELIDLLINIRTPKLSRDFKPTAMYEILENSLRQLTEDDLRPMSEAMENMDNIKLRIEQLEQSLKAVKQIDENFTKYNKFILKNKATNFLEKDQEVKLLKTDIEAIEREILRTEDKISNFKIDHIQLEEELDTAKKKIEEYKDNDVLKAKDKLEEVKIEIEKHINDKTTKEKILEEKKNKFKEKETEERQRQYALEEAEKETQEVLTELNNLAMEFSFSQQEIFNSELNTNYIKAAFDKHKEKLNYAKDILYQFQKKKEIYEETLQETDRSEKLVKDIEMKLKDTVEYLTTVKEELVEKVVKWNNGNRQLKLDSSLVQDVSRGIMGLEEFSLYQKTFQRITECFNRINAAMVVEEKTITKEVNDIDNEMEIKKIQIKELKEAKEVEYNRSPEVIDNRKKLKEMNIPFMPLYKALDFGKEVKDKEKQTIEAALVDLGIIDALVIPNKYKEKVLTTDYLEADKYLFADANLMGYSLAEYLKVDETELEGVTYQDIDALLRSVLLDENATIYLNEKGNYGMGILHGKIGKAYDLKYIGATARKQHRERKIAELNQEIEELIYSKGIKEDKLKMLKNNLILLQQEYDHFPSNADLNKSFELINEYEREFRNEEKKFSELKDKLVGLAEEMGELKKAVYEVTEGFQIEKNFKAYEDALEAAQEYRDTLTIYEKVTNDIEGLGVLLKNIKDSIEEFKEDISEKIGEISSLDQNIKNKRRELVVYSEILEKKGYDEIKEELDYCYNIVKNSPLVLKEKGNEIATLEERNRNNKDKTATMKLSYEKEGNTLVLLQSILMEEYSLGYVFERGLYDNPYKLSKEIIRMSDTYSNKSREEFDNALHESFNRNMGALRDYQPKTITIFRRDLEDEYKQILQGSERKDIRCRIDGKEVNFNHLKEFIKNGIEENNMLLTDKERVFFQDILLKTISNKIKAKIYISKVWVNEMNKLMESMNTSSSLKLTLKWEAKKAENEGQLDTKKIVELLEKDEGLIGRADIDELSKHFSAKIKEIVRSYEDKKETRNYHTVIKEILDYRKWYEFKLYSKKEGENQKELTNNAFFQLSGGEKAMAMYIPLFTAVYSKFDIATKKDCPRVIALDEAFAGVDEGNIRDMFRILKEMNLDYILNSQVLWGDYDTVEALSICEIIRPDNADVVTVFRYQWNGNEKVYIG